MRRDAAPLALHACQTLARPASLLAHDALGVGGQVALAPVVVLLEVVKRAVRHVLRCLAAVVYRQVLAVDVHVVLTDWLE